MANYTLTTSDQSEVLSGSVTLTKRTGTSIRFDTDGKYLAKDIQLSVSAQSATPSFDGGALSGGSTATGNSNVTLSTTNNGIEIQTAYTASHAAVLYNGTVNGWVSVNDNTQALASDSLSSTNGNAYYVTAVQVPKDKVFSITTLADTALDTTSDLTLTNAEYRRVIATNSGTIYARQTASDKGTVYAKAYGDSDDTKIIENGAWISTSVSGTGTFYGKVTVAGGTQTADSSANTNSTVTPSIALDNNASAYGFMISKPDGVTGTDFITINPEAQATDWSVTPRANITKAGYLAKASVTGTAVTGSPSIAAGTNYYIPIVTPTFAGGTLTATDFSVSDLAVTLSDGSDKNITAYTVGNKNTSTYPYYIKISGSTPSVIGTTSVSREAMTYSNFAGAMIAHTNESVLGAGSKTANVSVNAATGATYVNLKEAAVTITGTNTVTPSIGVVGSSYCELSDVNNGIAFTATGGGTASVTAIATTHQAGFAPDSTQIGNATLNASSNTTTSTKYVAGVRLIAASGNTPNTFYVTVPNGDSTLTFHFSVDKNGETTIT